MMRVLCISNLFPNPFRPGKGNFNYRAFEELSRLIDVRVISPVSWVDELRARVRGTVPYSRDAWHDWNGLQVHFPRYYYIPRSLRQWHGRFFYRSIRRTARRVIDEFKPDLIYGCWVYPDGWACWRLAQEFNLPFAVKSHGSDLNLLRECPARIPGTVGTLNHADGVFAVSNDLRNRAIGLGARPERVYVVYEGTDVERFCPGDRAAARQQLELPPNGRRLLFIGNLVAVKAIPCFIASCQHLVNAGIHFEADILGEGPLRNALQRQIDRLGLTSRIRLRGQKPNTELPNWYRAADLVVLSSYSEGVPNVLMEAAACGIPFVATAVGGIPEIANLTSGDLVPSGDSRALAQAIAVMLADPARLNSKVERSLIPTISNAARQKVEVFSELITAKRQSAAIAVSPSG